MRKLIFLLAALASVQVAFSQNLVNNPSFEIVTAEPFYGCELTNATGWLNPSGSPCPTNTGATPDLFSTFSTGQAVLPNSFMGTTNAHTGNRIAGIVTYHAQLANYREYLMTQLLQPLVPGQLYRVSFWTTGGNPVEYIYHTNNIELYFSNAPLSQSGYNQITGITPAFTISTIVANSVWTYYEFYYVPSAPITYFTVGNFKNDASTLTQNFGQNRPYAYYFFDDFEIITVTDSVTTQADTAICAGEPVTLTAQGSITGQYSWYIAGTPGTIIDNDSILNVAPTTTTTYVVQSPGSDDTITVTVTPSPVFTLGNDTTICQAQSVVLDPGIAGATYLWSTSAVTQTITVSTAGTYWLSVTQAGCSWVDTINISVLNPPAPINLGNDTSVCSGQLVLLSTGVANTIWSTGVSGPQITVSTSGTYAAGVVNACGAVADSVVVTILPLPIFTLGNDTTICQGQSVVLDPAIAGATYLWSTGAVTQTITVGTAGTYWLSVTQAGCSWVDTISISVLNPPAPVNIGNDTAVCFGQLVTLATGIASTLWSTGVTATQISVNTAATYWASVTNICGTEADTMVLTVNPAPVFTLGNDTSICQGQSVTLDPGIAGPTYLWSTGAANQTITVSTSGTYWLSVTQAGCSWVDTINVTVLNPPQPFTLGNDTSICQGETVVLNTGITSTVWSTGVSDSTISIIATGTYWAVISNICGTVSDTVNVTVNPLPVFNLGNDTTICQGQSVTLDPGISSAVYTWSTADVTQTISVNTPGNYALTVTQAGCTWADTINVTVLNPPQPFSLGNDTAICTGQTITLATGVSATVWSTGLTAAQIAVSTSGTYTATITNLCGTESDTIVLTVNPLPVVNLGNDTALCAGETFVLDATLPGATYRWQDNSTNATYTVTQQGTYAVTVTSNGCSASDAINISYQTIPQFLLGADTTLCIGDALLLSPFTGTNPIWQDGSTGSTFLVFDGGTFWVTVQTPCGVASDTIVIDYEWCDCYLTVPTAFSPNGDGLNDRYRPIYRCPIEKYVMRIHNRWGEVVYETTDINEGWDGTYLNTPQPISTFIWYIVYTNPYTDKEVFMKGNVTLIR